MTGKPGIMRAVSTIFAVGVRPLAMLAVCAAGSHAATAQELGFTDTPMLPGGKWHVHDSARPAPVVVTPGAAA